MSRMSTDKINDLKESLKCKGYKFTPQRRAIINGIIENIGQHITAEELYETVKKECPEIGLATVYRTLQLLEDMDIISKLDLDDGCSRFELVDETEPHQHHHLICNKCGKVIEVEGDLLGELESGIEKKYDFCIENHSLKFYGLCNKCKSNQR